MTETQKRIEAYKKALPEIRERVIAVALLFAMSMAMMTSATFAWLTISRAPEVTAVSTTVAANGNLEIALATGDGTIVPGESQVGDSSAREGQSVTAANITWGNLVNLSDPSYGLDNLTLRPAQLNTAALLASPLYGADYAGDGRVTQLDSNFAYTVWKEAEGDEPANFAVSDKFGVRAISSTKTDALGAAATYNRMVTAARNKNLAAANMYVNLGNNNKYMPSLATMMGLYMTARMNPSHATLSNPDCKSEDIVNLRDMYGAFLDAFNAEADAMAALLNLQLFLKHGEGNYTPYTTEMIYATTSEKLRAEGIQITNLDQFIKDRNTIASDWEKLKTIASSGTSLKWKDSGLNTIVNNLVDVGACTIGKDNTPISSIGASNAMGYLSGTQEARITNGILYRFEERTGGYIQVKNLGISATVSRSGITIPATVKANIQTTAPRDYNLFTNDLIYTEGLNTGDYQGGTMVAKETYGLAIDLWVRTNAGTQINNEDEETISGSYLTLEGNLLTESEMVRATGKDANGNTVELYTVKVSITDSDGSVISSDLTVYGVTAGEGDNAVTTWYNAETHSVVTAEEMGNNEPMAKMEEKITVTGFEGENRVWVDNDLLSVDSTTQGSGSCYVYYADTPEDQARSLKLLEAFNVAFVDAKGKLLATAIMDTANHYAASGRVIVPLVIDPSNSINLGEDENGNINYAITALEKNVPMRITAIVYLDGTKLTNQEVLAASEIQGQLNIQFGSSENMNPIKNEELESEERRVSAEVSRTSFDYDTATEPMTTTVTVHIDGDEPEKVTAFFLRQISSTQGSREETMTFTKNAEGDWTADYTFTAPGTYVLRTVRLDGVDYDLPPDNIPTVTVNGFAISSLTCTPSENRHIKVLTADNSSSFDVNLQFATSDGSKLPRTVQARFLKDDDGSAVNVELKPDANGIWKGTGTFLTSGTYTMQYVVLDGKYVELDSGLWHTADMTLGMRVAVYTTSPNSFKYLGEDMEDNQKLLNMQVKIMDNANEELPGITGVKLRYGMKGSGIKSMDADLTWDGNYYIGEMTNGGPGIWQFSSVTVGSNTITVATTSPTFTIMSPEPPEYYNHNTVAYQYTPGKNAVMNAQITNSAAATVQAYIIKDGAAEGAWVEGTMGGELTTSGGKPANHWTFNVPGDANGYQDGDWTLTQLKLWDVFAEDGTEYTEEAPLIIDLPENANNKTKVVNRIYVTFNEGQSKDFGKDADGNVTAQFMDSYTITGLNADIKDFAGENVPGVTDVKLMFAYKNGTSGTYGNYTSDQLNNATAGATVTVELDDNNGANYAQSEGATILYAGEYITTFSFKVNGTEYKYAGTSDNASAGTKALPANAPQFTVSSKAPTVTVTGTNPAQGTVKRIYSVSEPDNIGQLVEGDFFRFTNYSATVYNYTNLQSGRYDQEPSHAYTPEVTLALSGLPVGYSDATMEFKTNNTNSANSIFSFGNGTTAKANVGRTVDGEEGIVGVKVFPKSYPAGTMTQSKITLKYSGLVYEMILSNTVTINQAQSPTVLKFLGVPESYTGNKPSQVIGNGNVVTVTLPMLTWNQTIEEPIDGTWSEYAEMGEVKDANGNSVGLVYGFRYYTTGSGSTCDPTWYNRGCQYYVWTKFQSECTAVTNIYTQDKQIKDWIINGQTYSAGTTVQITGDGILNATAVVSDAGEKTFIQTKEQTSYKYLYGYVKGTSDTESSLIAFNNSYNGIQIGSTVNNSSDALPAAKVADPSVADASIDKPGTNMTTDSTAYEQYWP